MLLIKGTCYSGSIEILDMQDIEYFLELTQHLGLIPLEYHSDMNINSKLQFDTIKELSQMFFRDKFKKPKDYVFAGFNNNEYSYDYYNSIEIIYHNLVKLIKEKQSMSIDVLFPDIKTLDNEINSKLFHNDIYHITTLDYHNVNQLNLNSDILTWNNIQRILNLGIPNSFITRGMIWKNEYHEHRIYKLIGQANMSENKGYDCVAFQKSKIFSKNELKHIHRICIDKICPGFPNDYVSWKHEQKTLKSLGYHDPGLCSVCYEIKNDDMSLETELELLHKLDSFLKSTAYVVSGSIVNEQGIIDPEKIPSNENMFISVSN